MNTPRWKIVFCGLSITSSWGNGHATVYRGLVRELCRHGHDVLFLERDMPWYAANRDMPCPPFGQTRLYRSLDELFDTATLDLREADLVVVGSYVPDGVAVGKWAIANAGSIVAFYDIDTPVTLAKLARGDYEYLSPELVGQYDLYLSFTGGPILRQIEQQYGSPAARALYCCADPDAYRPMDLPTRWDLGYLGTYSDDRQPALDERLVAPARQWPQGRFVVAGPQYPDTLSWPGNVERINHLPPAQHAEFYNSQRFTLNITRADMVRAGYCPSVRLFEAAACGTPIVSDRWVGLDRFFELGSEIVVVDSAAQALQCLRDTPDEQRRAIGQRARQRVLAAHTAAHRAEQLEGYALAALGGRRPRRPAEIIRFSVSGTPPIAAAGATAGPRGGP